MPKCRTCPESAVEGEPLCIYCGLEHACFAMARIPDPEVRRCKVCSNAFQYTEARVIRNVKNPRVGSTVTPFLCWVCARLHISAQSQEEART